MAINAEIGSPIANSYITLVEADIYFADRMHSDAWENFEDKSSALITSSQMLDWYVKWKGYKTTSEQSMEWPRVNVIRRDGTEIASDIVPQEVKVAAFELALSSLEGDRTADDLLAGIEQIKAGTLMVKADSGDIDSTAADTIPERIWKILSDLYMRGDISVVRLMRA